MTTPLISCAGAVARREGFRLGPVSLEVEPGYVVAVVGPNGSGKSTLFNLMMDLVRPAEGEVRLFGHTYAEAGTAIRQRIGFVPERWVGTDRMTGASMASFAARWYPGWNDARYRELLAVMGIDPAERIGAFSKGARRRLASAVALATGGDLLLADEPMDAIDPFFSEQLLDWYMELMADGQRSIVFSTHALDHVQRVADYILLMQGGEVLGMYEKDALQEQWQVIWVDGAPIPGTPGVVAAGDGPLARVLTCDQEATMASLRAQGRHAVRMSSPELGEVLGELLKAGGTAPAPLPT